VLDVLLQVNVAVDERAGLEPAGCVAFARSLRSRSRLRVRGVMAVGPLDHASTPMAFSRAAGAMRALQQETKADILSLGMSGDLEAAVAAGSTMVRLGTALFGARPVRV
jgi:uncharacterized pyridoxal phosphate-containing UPF0001 family protein